MQRQALSKSQTLMIGQGSDEGLEPSDARLMCSVLHAYQECLYCWRLRSSQSFYEKDEPNGENPSLIVKYNGTLKN